PAKTPPEIFKARNSCFSSYFLLVISESTRAAIRGINTVVTESTELGGLNLLNTGTYSKKSRLNHYRFRPSDSNRLSATAIPAKRVRLSLRRLRPSTNRKIIAAPKYAGTLVNGRAHQYTGGGMLSPMRAPFWRRSLPVADWASRGSDDEPPTKPGINEAPRSSHPLLHCMA